MSSDIRYFSIPYNGCLRTFWMDLFVLLDIADSYDDMNCVFVPCHDCMLNSYNWPK